MDFYVLLKLGGQDASSTNSFDFFFCYPGKGSGLHNHWLFGHHTSTEDFEVTSTADVNDRCFLIILLVFNSGLFGNKGPQLVRIDGRTVLVWSVGMNVEVPHTDFAEITWMVLIKVDTMVMLSTGVTATSGMLPVFTNATMTMRNMASKLPGLLLVLAHDAASQKKSVWKRAPR